MARQTAWLPAGTAHSAEGSFFSSSNGRPGAAGGGPLAMVAPDEAGGWPLPPSGTTLRCDTRWQWSTPGRAPTKNCDGGGPGTRPRPPLGGFPPESIRPAEHAPPLPESAARAFLGLRRQVAGQSLQGPMVHVGLPQWSGHLGGDPRGRGKTSATCKMYLYATVISLPLHSRLHGGARATSAPSQPSSPNGSCLGGHQVVVPGSVLFSFPGVPYSWGAITPLV